MRPSSEALQMLDDLRHQVSWLYLRWRFFRALFVANKEHVDLLNHCAPVFFGDLWRILLDDVTIALARLVDRRREVVSLDRLHGLITTANSESESQLLKEQLSRVSEACRAIVDRRCSVVAHRNREVAYGDKVISSVSPRLVEEALFEVRRFMNLVETGLGRPETRYEAICAAFGSEDLITALKKARSVDLELAEQLWAAAEPTNRRASTG
jgi:hypothetical protein